MEQLIQELSYSLQENSKYIGMSSSRGFFRDHALLELFCLQMEEKERIVLFTAWKLKCPIHQRKIIYFISIV